MRSACASSPSPRSSRASPISRRCSPRRATAARAGQQTLLFVDEIHRFNRAQQDGFLPYVEDGTVDAGRRDHREPELRAQRRAALALPGADPAPPRPAGARGADPTAPRRCSTGPLPLTPEAREALIASADGDGRFLLNQVETLFSVELEQPLGPAELSRAPAPPRRGLRQGSRGPLQPHLRASQERFAAPTRRRRSIISRGCWSPARSRFTCSAA